MPAKCVSPRANCGASTPYRRRKCYGVCRTCRTVYAALAFATYSANQSDFRKRVTSHLYYGYLWCVCVGDVTRFLKSCNVRCRFLGVNVHDHELVQNHRGYCHIPQIQTLTTGDIDTISGLLLYYYIYKHGNHLSTGNKICLHLLFHLITKFHVELNHSIYKSNNLV